MEWDGNTGDWRFRRRNVVPGLQWNGSGMPHDKVYVLDSWLDASGWRLETVMGRPRSAFITKELVLDYNGMASGMQVPTGHTSWLLGWTPVVGDWNGDGKTEIGLFQNGSWQLLINGM